MLIARSAVVQINWVLFFAEIAALSLNSTRLYWIPPKADRQKKQQNAQ
jgi:hypothetical protein